VWRAISLAWTAVDDVACDPASSTAINDLPGLGGAAAAAASCVATNASGLFDDPLFRPSTMRPPIIEAH
jgi:hypothetical protein